MITQQHVDAAKDYFLALAEKEYEAYSALPLESPKWWFHRDRYVSLSNTAAQLMGDRKLNPFI